MVAGQSSSASPPVAIVTGGSRGIGAACVVRLASDGYRVVTSGRDAEALEAMHAGLPAGLQDRVTTRARDSRDRDTAALLVSAAVDGFGRLDVLVANSGRYLAARVGDTTPEEWHDVLAANLSAVLWLIQAALPELRRSAGYVIAIGSVSGTRGFEHEGAYGASKRALRILTESVTREEASFGVRASLVSPGAVRTRMAAQAFQSEAYGADGQAPGVLLPSDIAESVAYLLSLSSAARIDEIVVGDSRWAHLG